MELADAMGLPRSTVSRLLQRMHEAGLVERDPQTLRYSTGLLVFEAGRGYRAGDPLIEAADAAIASLSRRTGHSFGVSVLVGRDVMGVRYRVGSQPLRVVLPPGERSPAMATATGRALLARKTDDAVRGLFDPFPEPPTSRAPASLEALLRRLAVVRARGHELAVDEVFDGLAAIAVAVSGDEGERMTVALFAAFSALHVSAPQRQALAAQLRQEAGRLGRAFGDPCWAASCARDVTGDGA